MRPALPEEIKNGMILANVTAVTDKTIEISQLNDVGLNEVYLLLFINYYYLNASLFLSNFLIHSTVLTIIIINGVLLPKKEKLVHFLFFLIPVIYDKNTFTSFHMPVFLH